MNTLDNTQNESIRELIVQFKMVYSKDTFDEQYKWELIANAVGKTPYEIIDLLKNYNLIHNRTANGVFKYHSENNQEAFKSCLNDLVNEEAPLHDRLVAFKKTMHDMGQSSWNNYANDERTAAAILSCYNPVEYTFYKKDVYCYLCDFLHVEMRKTGHKYEHFLSLVKAISADFGEEIQGVMLDAIGQYTQKSLLLAVQTMLWCMMNHKEVVDKQKIADTNIVKPEENVDEMKIGYWWLLTNPKIWSAQSWKVGDTQDFTLRGDSGKKRRVYQNFLDAKIGDLVMCYESTPTLQIVALAVVERESDGETIVFKKIESLENPVDLSTVKKTVGLQDMEYLKNTLGTLFKLTESEYIILDELVHADNLKQTVASIESYVKEDFLKEVFMTAEDYERLKMLLFTKQNIILQGAPGVGKTFSAMRLAYSIIGLKDKSKVEMVQFHQSYSYEDFIMGYKPNEDGGFELRRGVFYKFCKRAASDPENKYFFVIDEINRGNISKILGELMMLIEKGYRGVANAIKLPYNQEDFFVPENLYIIGMMNTADRSLAMMDYALRRRFSFFELKSGLDTNGFKAYQTSLNNAQFDKLIDTIKALNNEITKDDSLGNGFCIGHSYFCNQETVTDVWLRNVVDFDIIPMIREYWFDDDKKYKEESQKLIAAIR